MPRLAAFLSSALLGAGLALSGCAEVPPPAKPAAAAPAAPAFATTKVTDNVYIFRYRFHQSMFVVTPAGVVATDPISGRYGVQAAEAYVAEIRKITDAPIKYVVYSHHHFDHAAGGAPFKKEGATFIAHRNATARLKVLKNPDVVMPDISMGDKFDIRLGGMTVELRYVGRNHSDNMIVMRVPKDKILFAVDFIPIEGVQFRDMPDGYLPDWFDSLDRTLALDWERMIPGHPTARLGTKDDVRNLRAYMTDLMEATRVANAEGKCFDRAMAEIKLPKYEKWGGYKQYLPGNIERFCEYWNGI